MVLTFWKRWGVTAVWDRGRSCLRLTGELHRPTGISWGQRRTVRRPRDNITSFGVTWGVVTLSVVSIQRSAPRWLQTLRAFLDGPHGTFSEKVQALQVAISHYEAAVRGSLHDFRG